MRVLRSLAELAQHAPSASVVTIGNFDGVHCGHRMVIAAVRESARKRNALSAAITFNPHPAHLLRADSRLPLITPLNAKLDLLASTSLDLAFVVPFTQDLRSWTAHRFAADILRDGLHAVEVHEGETFRLGQNADVDIHGLQLLGQDMGFTVRSYAPFVSRGAPISSSRIRALITTGHLAQARVLLGRNVSVHSTPASGRGYGTRYAVPTINLAPYADLLPAHGVYVTLLRIGTGPTAPLFRGVTNIGNRPTFGEDSFAVESYLFDFKPVDLTESTPLELTFLLRLRDEQRFASPELLRAQIGKDVARAQRYFRLADLRQARF